MMRAVVFDVGETLVNEERHWGEWADWLGVTRFALFAALGAVIARDEQHWSLFQIVRPGLDREAEIAKREAAGWTYRFEPSDFYPDAIACLEWLLSATEPAHLNVRTDVYERLYRRALRCARVEIDRDGDGRADLVRPLNVLELQRI